MNQKGFTPLIIVLGIILIIGIAGGVYYFGKTQNLKPQPQNPVATSQTPQPTPISSTPPVQYTTSPSPLISPITSTDRKISLICPTNEGYRQPTLDVNEAAKIAKETNCSAEGTLDISSASCMISGNNWSFGFQSKENKNNCGVVCYVDSKTKIAELLWMCGGYVPSPPKAFENP